MSVAIIQGIEELIAFYNTISAASATSEYISAAATYQALVEQGVTTQAVINGVIDTSKVMSQVVEAQTGLTGGTQAGVAVSNVAETAGGVSVTSGEALVTATPIIEIVGGILAGLGVGIVSYEANKDFWIDISNNLFLNFPGYVPITYDNIEDMSLSTLFKSGKTYVSAETVQEINNKLIAMGVFSQGQSSVTYDLPSSAGRYTMRSAEATVANIKAMVSAVAQKANISSSAGLLSIARIFDALDFYGIPSNVTHFSVICQRNTPTFNVYLYSGETPVDVDSNGWQVTHWYSDHALVRHYWGNGSTNTFGADSTDQSFYLGLLNVTYTYLTSGSSLDATIVVYPDIPELPLLPDSIHSTVPDNIPLEMPNWWANILEIGSIDPNTQELTLPQYLPVSVPNVSPVTNPVTTPQPTAQTGEVPDTNPDPVGDSTLPIMIPDDSPYKAPKEPTPKPTPTPVIPVIPAIGGQANKLFTVYNPSQSNLDALGSTLWTQNIITQIVQMFTNNPMDAIISLHILYATPTTGANKEIKLGYVPTGVSCPEVTNQYVNVDCGTVRIPELFGDVRDYANTDISIYLPMIGFRQLKTEDAMASYVSVDYKVDVFTGVVLATVTINKGSVNQVFYTYEGNCAVNLPLTGADKSRQMATAVGAVGAMVTGNPLMGLGSATAIAGGSAKAQIQRSGNFTGNAGAMGCKKPYIIVSSDVPYDAVGYNAQYGYPANLTVMLGTCHGYVKAKEVHADTIANATEKEKREIENQLKQGVIIH